MPNPLLDLSGLPRFAAIGPEHVAPAVDELIAAARAAITDLARIEAPTWERFVEPLDDVNERLARAWSLVSHLNAVANNPQLREAYNAALPKVTQFFSEQGQDARLHAQFKALAAAPGFARWKAARRRHVEIQLRDFRLGGAELGAGDKARFLAIQEELAALGSRFQDNLLDATEAFALYVTERAELSGIPEDVLAAAHEAAAKEGRAGWKLTLRWPCYQPVLQYADHHGLRERMYRGYVTRASELDDPARDNTPLMKRILELRGEAARLLGFATFAELSLARKMAASPDEVLGFLGDLAGRARAFAREDMAELTEFARLTLNLADVRACDVWYVREKLRRARYDFSEEEVKPYFREDTVLAGMFRLAETIYGVRIRSAEAETWHPSVRFFEIADGDGPRIGQFYLDLYARQGKRGGGWIEETVNRRRRSGGVQTPLTIIACNFPAPAGGRPALFTHGDVGTLFHEFGHALHQLLTEVDELGVSGLNGVEWDAVEMPSQLMENFRWEWGVVEPMTRHVDTGERMPRALFERLREARNFARGLEFVRQLEFATFDMLLHCAFDPRRDDARALLARVREQVAVIRYPDYNRFANQFAHIFANSYAAGYYSYKWAEVLSADAYAAFEEVGVLDAGVGRRFRHEVLARGGSRPAMESFVAFRGRRPQIDALLRHNGMTAPVEG